MTGVEEEQARLDWVRSHRGAPPPELEEDERRRRELTSARDSDRRYPATEYKRLESFG